MVEQKQQAASGIANVRAGSPVEKERVNGLQRRLFEAYLVWAGEQNPSGTVDGEDVLSSLAGVCGEMLATVPPRLRQPAAEAFGNMVVNEANRRVGRTRLRGIDLRWVGRA